MSKDCIICGSKIPPHKTKEGVVWNQKRPVQYVKTYIIIV